MWNGKECFECEKSKHNIHAQSQFYQLMGLIMKTVRL
jgi:hypothetical protein